MVGRPWASRRMSTLSVTPTVQTLMRLPPTILSIAAFISASFVPSLQWQSAKLRAGTAPSHPACGSLVSVRPPIRHHVGKLSLRPACGWCRSTSPSPFLRWGLLSDIHPCRRRQEHLPVKEDIAPAGRKSELHREFLRRVSSADWTATTGACFFSSTSVGPQAAIMRESAIMQLTTSRTPVLFTILLFPLMQHHFYRLLFSKPETPRPYLQASTLKTG